MAGPLDDDLDQEQAEHRAPDRADAAREAAPADDGGGDRVQLVGDAQPGVGLAAPAGEEDAPERREHAREAVGDRLEPAGRQAAEPGGGLVAPEGEQVPAQHRRPHHHARRRRRPRRRSPASTRGCCPKTRNDVERHVDRLVLAQDRRQAPQAGHRRQRGDERGSRSWLIRKACRSPIARPMSRVRAIARPTTPEEGGIAAVGPDRSQSVSSLALDDRREGDDRADREVDAPGDDHHRRPDREHAEQRHLVEQVWRLYSEKNARDASRK